MAFIIIISMRIKLKHHYLICFQNYICICKTNLIECFHQGHKNYLNKQMFSIPKASKQKDTQPSSEHKHERFPVLSHHLLTNDLFIIRDLRMRRSLVKLLGLVKFVTEMVTVCLRAKKCVIFVV